MMEHIQAQTYHARRGGLKNAFRYGVDYVLTDFEAEGLRTLSRNRFNLWSLWDHKHGGPRGAGRGLGWFREELRERGLPLEGTKLLLLTQPSFMGMHFNPVSFWIATRNGAPCAFVAEVNNTFGHRHCYFCAHEDFRPITPSDVIVADKMMHVSPFQKVEGTYQFVFGMTEAAFNIRITYRNGNQGVIATLIGSRRQATDGSLVWAAVRRPFGAARVLALIHWQAAVLFLKRAPFQSCPAAPEPMVTDCRNTRRFPND